jgi:UDP-2,3-diacylglucosamine pyrophosphatase LpxH
MMSQPHRLADFIGRLTTERNLAGAEAIELVVAGDFLDFLAIPPSAAFTPDPTAAVAKLRRTMSEPPFDAVFTALGRFLHAGHHLSVLVGNHDVELTFPSVQEALLVRMAAAPGQVAFLDDGCAYRLGGVLIEHGNRYDGANENDWTGLRAFKSAQSRYEKPPEDLVVSAGSKIVHAVVNPLKERYPFIDLLQPQGEVVALLLLAFEPGLIWDVRKLANMLSGRRLQGRYAQGQAPGETRHVSATPPALGPDPADPELARVFGATYEALRAPVEQVSSGDLASVAWAGRGDGLRDLLARSEPIPRPRLEQIQTCLRRLLVGDRSDRVDGPTEQYGAAAERLRAGSGGEVDVVVMGHTHLARHIGPAERATYINTGTWADVVRVPESALEPGGLADLEAFLRRLQADHRPPRPLPYADLRFDSDGHVKSAALQWVES